MPAKVFKSFAILEFLEIYRINVEYIGGIFLMDFHGKPAVAVSIWDLGHNGCSFLMYSALAGACTKMIGEIQ